MPRGPGSEVPTVRHDSELRGQWSRVFTTTVLVTHLLNYCPDKSSRHIIVGEVSVGTEERRCRAEPHYRTRRTGPLRPFFGCPGCCRSYYGRGVVAGGRVYGPFLTISPSGRSTTFVPHVAGASTRPTGPAAWVVPRGPLLPVGGLLRTAPESGRGGVDTLRYGGDSRGQTRRRWENKSVSIARGDSGVLGVGGPDVREEEVPRVSQRGESRSRVGEGPTVR